MEIDTQKIKTIMEEKGLDITNMAQLMGKKESWVYAVLGGVSGKTFSTVEDFAKVLGVKETEIVIDG